MCVCLLVVAFRCEFTYLQADVVTVLEEVVSLTTTRFSFGNDSHFTVFPVIAGTAPSEARDAVRIGPARTLDPIPIHLLSRGAVFSLARHLLHAALLDGSQIGMCQELQSQVV